MGGGGGGGPVPRGRRHWIGIHFCHPEVVKLQQQCQMQNTIFDLPHNWFYSFFFSERERECQYILETNRRIGRKNENDNPVRKWYKWSSITTLIFGFFLTLGRNSGFSHVPGETGNSGNKVGKWQFLDLKSNNCVEFSVFNVFSQ